MTKRVCFYNCFPDELLKQIAQLEKEVDEIKSVQYTSVLTPKNEDGKVYDMHFAWISYEGETPEWVKEMKNKRGKKSQKGEEE